VRPRLASQLTKQRRKRRKRQRMFWAGLRGTRPTDGREFVGPPALGGGVCRLRGLLLPGQCTLRTGGRLARPAAEAAARRLGATATPARSLARAGHPRS